MTGYIRTLEYAGEIERKIRLIKETINHTPVRFLNQTVQEQRNWQLQAYQALYARIQKELKQYESWDFDTRKL